MLALSEFGVGAISEASFASLVWPMEDGLSAALVGEVDETPTVVFLQEHDRFECPESIQLSRKAALIIPNVQIEVDEATAFDPSIARRRLGTLIIAQGNIAVVAKRPKPSFGGVSSVIVGRNHPEMRFSAGFANWQIVVGTESRRRVLLQVEAAPVSD